MKSVMLPAEVRSQSRVQSIGWASLSGLLLGLSFPPFPSPTAWIALVPLFHLAIGVEGARARYGWAVWSLAVSDLVAFHWVLFHPIGSVAWTSAAILATMPFLQALPFLVVPDRLRKKPYMFLAVLSVFWLFMEWLSGQTSYAFPWALLAHTQASHAITSGAARIVGPLGVSLLVLLANTLAFTMLRKRVCAFGFLAVVVLLVFPWARGATGAGSRVRIGVVQPSVSPAEWADPQPRKIFGLLRDMSDSLLRVEAKPSLLVWPETALRTDLDSTLGPAVQQWVDATGVALLTGAVEENAQQEVFNSAFLFTPGGRRVAYRKRRLVPFAEYSPDYPLIGSLQLAAGGRSGYAPGNTANVFRPGGDRGPAIGTLICFESLFPTLSHRYVKEGANLLVVLSQDGWWGRTFGYRQHFAYTRFRAIETGVPVLFVSVTGLSGLILPDGRVVERTEWMQRRAYVVSVPLSKTNQ